MISLLDINKKMLQVVKRVALVIVTTVIMSTSLFAKPSKPIPICANIYELAAYEMATELTEMCSGASFSKVKKHILIVVKEQNDFSCNTACWLMSGTADMETCVNNLVDSYVSAFMETTRKQHGEEKACPIVKGW
jgi:hypothetical protein